MQLDRTRIVVRERSYLDIADLSLAVCRRHAAPMAKLFLPFAAAALCLNHFLLTITLDLTLQSDRAWYVFLQPWLILLETPTVTAPLTLYLGQATFVEQPSLKRVLVDFLKSTPQLIVFQWMLRGLLMTLCGVGLLVYLCGGPYLNEIILLERNSMGAAVKRGSVLHADSSGLIVGRWMGSLVLGGLLFFSLWGTLAVLGEKLLGRPGLGQQSMIWEMPIALWLTFGFFTVVRFLSYLDLRIRREGWEIELRMRAEAARLTRRIS